MPWSEVRPGHYQRPIGENEKFIKAVGDRAHASGREHWSITCSASFILTKPLNEDTLYTQLRNAWKALRFEHPNIAATAEEETLNYIVPNKETLEAWAKETFFIHDTDKTVTADDLTATFRPHPQLTAHYLPETSQLVIHTAHWRTDGFGALQLLNAYFENWSNLPENHPAEFPWGQEVERLLPSVEHILNLPITATPEIDAATENYISTLAYARGAIGLSYKGDKRTLPSGTRSARLRLSESDTNAISEVCSAQSISVLSAVHASVASITCAGTPADSKSDKHYTSTVRLSLRPHLPEPYNSSRSASGLYTGGYFYKVPASQSWSMNAKQYDEEYRRGVTSDFLMTRRQYALRVQEIQRKAAVPAEGPPPSEVDISSVDDANLLVESDHRGLEGSIEVVDVSVGVETLTRQMYCFVWTFRNQIEFNLVYNEAYYDQSFAGKLLDSLQDEISRSGRDLVTAKAGCVAT